jgi:hypothetical protein
MKTVDQTIEQIDKSLLAIWTYMGGPDPSQPRDWSDMDRIAVDDLLDERLRIRKIRGTKGVQK